MAPLGPDGAIDQVRLMYYDATWRLLEERVDDAAASSTTLEKLYDGTWAVTAVDRTQQNLWGLRYIDDIVMHRTDRNRDGDYVDTTDGTWYHLTDAQFSSVCLTDVNANVVERVTYSAYGIARHHWMADVNGDGAVTTSGTTSDRGIINGIASQTLANRSIGGSAYRAEADLDRSGVIDITDRGMASTALAARPDGQVSDISTTGPDNVIAWDGYVFNAEPGLYVVRHRTYGPRLGRWLERDPAGYVDSTNLFQSLRSSPLSRVDPSGTDSFAVEWEKRNNARKARVKRVRDAVSEGACGDCCEVRVYATSAFFTGFYHLCIEADTPSGQAGLCDTTTAELLRANETGREAERVGEGPVGGIFGSVRSGSSQSSDDASVDSIGGSPNRAWGIYVASGKRCRSGEALDASFVEPAAGSGKDQCELARCIREAASRIGAAAGAAKHAYDPLENNSNSFIGQIIRECGGAFDSAIDVKNAPAFNNPFFKGNT